MADDKKRDDYAADMSEKGGYDVSRTRSPLPPQTPVPPQIAAVANNPVFPVLSYCASSILMTVTNKYVLSGLGFNLNFFLLCVQVRYFARCLDDSVT